ncbi:unnamed protein product [Adineta steineri]|uniref:Uncharacterized protein n=1 Tax=Adineta steineri TaxID=433720 RepID=A0A819ZTE1_9BILA|nr:unnamed protein product [Adineta steineri]CAF4175565.1 unnamed protein product [Adineta steineri]
MTKDTGKTKKSDEKPTEKRAETPPSSEPPKQESNESSKSNKTTSKKVLKKHKRCGGNACPDCGKCTDWKYNGDIHLDHLLHKHNESHALLNPQRWTRSPNATCLVYTNGFIYSTGDTSSVICQCSSE